MTVYANHDIKLRNSAFLRLQFLDKNGVGIGDNIRGSGEKQIKFQFPPRILSDNRKGTWIEKEVRGTEPVAAFKTSGPREISLSWTYIIDGDQWTTEVVAAQVKLIRGYFAAIRDVKNTSNRKLAVEFKYILFGDSTPMSARIKSIDVKHGETIVCSNVSTGGELSTSGVEQRSISAIDNSYPLRTDINIALRLWSQAGENGEVIQDLEDLQPRTTPRWY